MSVKPGCHLYVVATPPNRPGNSDARTAPSAATVNFDIVARNFRRLCLRLGRAGLLTGHKSRRLPAGSVPRCIYRVKGGRVLHA